MEKNNLNKNWIEWFIGFCDADANFQVFPKVRKSERGVYYNIGYGFHISLSDKDLDLLIDIQNKLKIGKIYEYPEKEEARLAIFEWITWYNNERLHSSLDYMSPREFEESWHSQQAA